MLTNFSSTTIAPGKGGFVTASDAALRHVIQQARLLGLRVMLSPRVFVQDGSSCTVVGRHMNDALFSLWMDSYRIMMLHYAQLAEQEGAGLLSLG